MAFDAENKLGAALERVRAQTPLVHCITNYVTVNDVANALIACGGSPIMADEEEDACAITGICGGLVLNIGTLNTRTIQTMHAVGKIAGGLGHPIVLDPVGAGASELRTRTATELAAALPLACVRGNMSEVRALAGEISRTRGVDVNPEDAAFAQDLSRTGAFARELAGRLGAVVAITGAVDIVADAKRAVAIENGTAMMGTITGTGCMLDGIVAAYLTANPADPFTAVVAAVAGWGLAGEVATARLSGLDGSGSFRTYLIDAAYQLTPEALQAGARVREV